MKAQCRQSITLSQFRKSLCWQTRLINSILSQKKNWVSFIYTSIVKWTGQYFFKWHIYEEDALAWVCRDPCYLLSFHFQTKENYYTIQTAYFHYFQLNLSQGFIQVYPEYYSWSSIYIRMNQSYSLMKTRRRCKVSTRNIIFWYLDII